MPARSREEIADVIERVGRLLRLSDNQDALAPAGRHHAARAPRHPVADDLTWEEFAQVNVMAPELTGISAEVGELRSYPLQAAFYHTIGYVQKANEADIQQMIKIELEAAGESAGFAEAGKARAAAVRRLYRHPAMRVGKQGIEAYGEQQLKGEPGKIRLLQNADRPRDRPPAERRSQPASRARTSCCRSTPNSRTTPSSASARRPAAP